MGYAGKTIEKEKAIKLRKTGLSYSEIRKIVNVSKDTLSRWCRDLALSHEQMERLYHRKIVGAESGRIIGAKKLQAKRLAEIAHLLSVGKKEIGTLTQRERFIAGVGLYIGDGLKSDMSVGFSNSDPKTISFMMKWIREFCQIPEARLSGQIWIHDNLDEQVAKKFWSRISGIAEQRFQKSYISKNISNSKKIRKNIHQYGVFAVRASLAKSQRRILGWMSGILDDSRL